MSRTQSSPPSVSSSVTTVIYAPLPKKAPSLTRVRSHVSAPPSIKAPTSVDSMASTKRVLAPGKPGQAALPLTLSSTFAACAIAGIGVAAAFFPLALIAIVPITLLALALVGYSAREVAVEREGAREPQLAVKRAFSPTPSEPQEMPAAMMRGVKAPLDTAAHAESRALVYLDYLAQPSRFSPDLLIGPLAQARSYKARLWERNESDEKNYAWQSMDLAQRFFDTQEADDRTIHLAVGDRHFWTLQLHGDKEPDCDDVAGTKIYAMQVQRAEDTDENATEKYQATEIPALGGGDCLFHAWAAGENYEGYNDLSPTDIPGKQGRADALRETAVTAATELVNAGDQSFIREMAKAADEEFNLHWLAGQHMLVAARVNNEGPALTKVYLESAQNHLFVALELLAPHQTEAHAAVVRRLKDTHRLQQQVSTTAS